MGLRALVGIDLAGTLAACRRKFRDDVSEFDYRTVMVGVSVWGDEPGSEASVAASAYCTDLALIGLSIRYIAWFYWSPLFKSKIEAEAHAEAEIRRATKRHPQTRFYRKRLADEGYPVFEYCKNGVWTTIKVEDLPCVHCCRTISTGCPGRHG